MNAALIIAGAIALVTILFALMLIRESQNVSKKRHYLLQQLGADKSVSTKHSRTLLIIYVVTTIVWTGAILFLFTHLR